MADGEGVSLNQYIVYALTRQVTLAYSVNVVSREDIQQQEQSFNALMKGLEKASSSEVSAALAEREMASPEKGLVPHTVALLQEKIQDAAKTHLKADHE